MKILYVISRLDEAGPVNQLFDMIIGLDRKEYEIMILTMQHESSRSRWKDFQEAGFCVKSLNLTGKLNFLKKIQGLNKVIEEFQPDIIHSECLPADMVVAMCEGKGAKKLTTMHCDIYTDYPLLKKGLFAVPFLPKIMLKAHEECLKKFDLLIGCSYTLQRLYENRYPNVTAVQNGIATERFSYVQTRGDAAQEQARKSAKKRELGLDPELPMAVVVGSLDVRKNTEFIINSLGDLTVDEEHPFQLVFLGTGEKISHFKQLSLGKNVFFKGKVPNVEEYLRCADIYLSASKSEGLPLSVLEAGCCGLKMVLSGIPQHKEMIKEEGIRGIFFFDETNIEELQKTAKICLLEEENGKEISDYFRTRFSSKRMRNQYMECYQNCLESKNG